MKARPQAFAAFPAANLEGNPFQIPLERELQELGWVRSKFNLSLRNLVANRSLVSVLHFHWPEAIWRSNWVGLSAIKALWFVFRCEFAKMLRYRVVWSAHNVMPHQTRCRLLEALMRRYLLSRADGVVGHAYNTEAHLVEKFGTSGRRYILALHGLYNEIYKTTTSKAETKHAGGKQLVLLMFMSKASCKCAKRLLSALSRRNCNSVVIQIVGGYAEALPRTEHIEHHGFVSRAKLASMLHECDGVLLPYDYITTSGAFFLAVTAGKSVIAPALDFFRLHGAPGFTWLFDGESEDSMCSCVEKWAKSPKADDVTLTTIARRYDWKTSAAAIDKLWKTFL